MGKEYRGIRQKLVLKVFLILVVASVTTLMTVAYFNIQDAKQNLSESERQITGALIAKGKILTTNNGISLQGMVEVNASGAVQALISSTVASDSDIIFGTYLDEDLMPWVYSHTDNPQGIPKNRDSLNDANSTWALELTEPAHFLTSFRGQEIYLFDAPVVIDNEIVGHVQYGLSTSSLRGSLEVLKSRSQKNLILTLSVLVVITILIWTVAFIAVRNMARNIAAPLLELKNVAERINRGEYENGAEIKSAEVYSHDEIGDLAKVFEVMRITICRKIDDLAAIKRCGQSMAAAEDIRQLAIELIQVCHSRSSAMTTVFEINTSNGFQALLALHDETLIEKEHIADFFKRKPDIADAFSNQEDSEPGIQYRQVVIQGQSYNLLDITINDGDENALARIRLGGAIYSDDSATRDFYQSISRIVAVNLRKIQIRTEIDELNRTLEEKVKVRTAALQEKTNGIQTMMKNLHQGLFTITDSGTIHPEYSKCLENIFDTNDIAGKAYDEFLFSNCNLGSNTIDQIRASIDSMLGGDALTYHFNSHLLVNEMEHGNETGDNSILQIDWAPILVEGTITKVMVTLRDITELKRLELETKQQREELDLAGQVLNVEPEKFSDFLQSAFALLKENIQVISDFRKGDFDIDRLFRNIHTIKGDSRTYGLLAITDCVHEAETVYDNIRNGLTREWQKEDLLADLQQINVHLENYQHINDEVLKRNKNSANETSLTSKTN